MPKIISISQTVLEIMHGNETEQTDRQTDGWTDRRGDSYIPPLNFVYGGYNNHFVQYQLLLRAGNRLN